MQVGNVFNHMKDKNVLVQLVPPLDCCLVTWKSRACAFTLRQHLCHLTSAQTDSPRRWKDSCLSATFIFVMTGRCAWCPTKRTPVQFVLAPLKCYLSSTDTHVTRTLFLGSSKYLHPYFCFLWQLPLKRRESLERKRVWAPLYRWHARQVLGPSGMAQ